ncbi:unnamed protein product [Closterium sp. NIES-65]|nr:unnamed protein product [Closterium sp. NIES-65]CAI5998496.1 unnamed protein product [Closterium sp. NIES-65]
MALCSCPKALTSKVVYADENSGHVHLCLPFYVDVCGECHLSLYRGCCCSGARTLHNHPAEIEERRELMGKVLAELMARAQKRRKMKAREAIAKVQAAKEARMQHVDKAKGGRGTLLVACHGMQGAAHARAAATCRALIGLTQV